MALAENSEKLSARDIAKQLAELSLVDWNPRLVQNRIHENNLYGRSLVKKPLLT